MAYDAMINNILKHDCEEDSMLDESNFGANESEYVLSSINQIIKEKMLELCMIWVEIGIPKTKRLDRLEEVKNLIEEQTTDVFNTIKDTETKTLKDLKDYRVTKLKEINKILNDLKLPPFELPSNCSLFNIAKILHYKFDNLNKLKKERVNKWSELKNFKSQLSKQLGSIEKAFNLDTGIPSEDELMKLQSHVNDLQKEVKERTDKFKRCENEIKVLFDYLEYNKPSKDKNEFEKYYFDKKPFILSDKYMKELDEFQDKLTKQFEENKLNKSLKMEKLNSLWKKLDIDEEEQKSIQRLIEDCKPSTLKLIQFKIDELEELKRQNISKFIDKLKPEIEEWWVKCCVSEQKMASFAENYFEAKDEATLDKLEQELERLQRFYCENEVLFLKYHQWDNLTRRLDELEIKSKDPNRLYNNRGGALLREEKERKELQRKLPKIEIELKQLSNEWLSKNNGQVFKIYDKTIELFFEEYYAEKQTQKENEKEKKKMTKQQELEAQSRLTINSPCKSASKVKRMIASQTASSTKRFKPLEKPLGINRNQAGISKTTTTARKGIVKSLKPEFVKKVGADLQIEINTIINESQFQSAIIDSNDILNSTNIKGTPKCLNSNKYYLRKKISQKNKI